MDALQNIRSGGWDSAKAGLISQPIHEANFCTYSKMRVEGNVERIMTVFGDIEHANTEVFGSEKGRSQYWRLSILEQRQLTCSWLE